MSSISAGPSAWPARLLVRDMAWADQLVLDPGTTARRLALFGRGTFIESGDGRLVDEHEAREASASSPNPRSASTRLARPTQRARSDRSVGLFVGGEDLGAHCTGRSGEMALACDGVFSWEPLRPSMLSLVLSGEAVVAECAAPEPMFRAWVERSYAVTISRTMRWRTTSA